MMLHALKKDSGKGLDKHSKVTQDWVFSQLSKCRKLNELDKTHLQKYLHSAKVAVLLPFSRTLLKVKSIIVLDGWLDVHLSLCSNCGGASHRQQRIDMGSQSYFHHCTLYSYEYLDISHEASDNYDKQDILLSTKRNAVIIFWEEKGVKLLDSFIKKIELGKNVDTFLRNYSELPLDIKPHILHLFRTVETFSFKKIVFKAEKDIADSLYMVLEGTVFLHNSKFRRSVVKEQVFGDSDFSFDNYRRETAEVDYGGAKILKLNSSAIGFIISLAPKFKDSLISNGRIKFYSRVEISKMNDNKKTEVKSVLKELDDEKRGVFVLRKRPKSAEFNGESNKIKKIEAPKQGKRFLFQPNDGLSPRSRILNFVKETQAFYNLNNSFIKKNRKEYNDKFFKIERRPVTPGSRMNLSFKPLDSFLKENIERVLDSSASPKFSSLRIASETDSQKLNAEFEDSTPTKKSTFFKLTSKLGRIRNNRKVESSGVQITGSNVRERLLTACPNQSSRQGSRISSKTNSFINTIKLK